MAMAVSERPARPRGETMTVTETGVLVVAAYIAAQILADIGSLKIALVAGFSVDGGTFIYPLTFTLRDMVHKLLGRRAARTLILTAAGINVVMALFFAFLSWLPTDTNVAAPGTFASVLNPVWRIVVASIVAEVVSELLDTELYHAWVTRVTESYQWMRVLFSNSISIPVDSLIFCWIAFGGLMPAATVWSIVLSNVIIKMLTTLVSLPGIYLVKENPAQ